MYLVYETKINSLEDENMFFKGWLITFSQGLLVRGSLSFVETILKGKNLLPERAIFSL